MKNDRKLFRHVVFKTFEKAEHFVVKHGGMILSYDLENYLVNRFGDEIKDLPVVGIPLFKSETVNLGLKEEKRHGHQLFIG